MTASGKGKRIKVHQSLESHEDLPVTPEDVRSTAERHLDPQKFSIAIVGTKKEIDKQLGEVKIIRP